jgi:hypothetical protein
LEASTILGVENRRHLLLGILPGAIFVVSVFVAFDIHGKLLVKEGVLVTAYVVVILASVAFGNIFSDIAGRLESKIVDAHVYPYLRARGKLRTLTAIELSAGTKNDVLRKRYVERFGLGRVS